MKRQREPEVLHLGKRIRRERTRQGLSLKEIEKRAGISPTHVSEIERGRSSPTVGALVKIAQALERPLAHFVEILPEQSAIFSSDRPRREWVLNHGSVRLEPLLDPAVAFDLSVSLLCLDAGARLAEQECHLGVRELFAHVIEGCLEISVGDEDFMLAEGDSIHLRADQTSGIGNPTAVPARAYLLTYPRIRL